MHKIAFGSVPKDGGTFTFYRNMRPALLEHGIDMRCVAIGKDQAELWENPYVDDGCVLLAPTTRNIKQQAQVFADWCQSESIDIVMGINSEAMLSTLPHLPEGIRCMSRCANSFDHGYRITLSGLERLAGIIAQTPRQQKDLTEHYGVDPEAITVIPNGIDPCPFDKSATRSRTTESEPLRLGFLGRLEHKQKGVLFIPQIVRDLNLLGVHYTLKIAGKGRHEAELRKQFAAEGIGQKAEGKRDEPPTTPQPHQTLDPRPSTLDSKVQFLGAIPPKDIPDFLADTDILIFPSQFEGCPNALLEAMLAGCVPVAWKLEGITDFIIEHGISGCVAELGDTGQFASYIAAYARDRTKLEKAQQAAAQQSRARFRTEIAAAKYAEAIHKVMAHPAPDWTPKSWSQFRPDPNFEHSWKEWIPKSIKETVRKAIGSGP